MRILLIGEYSRLHNSLKEGLTQLGHDVTILAGGDGFKKYPVDFQIKHSFNSYALKKIKLLIYKLTSIDLQALELYYKASKIITQLDDFDVVQLINESSIKTSPKLEIKFLKKALNKTKKLFLLSCGVDYTCMKYMMDKKPRYSLMSAYIENKSLKKTYKFQLKYLSKEHKKLHDFIIKNCHGVIASDFDYHLPCLNSKKYLGLIPNPININLIKYIPIEFSGKIKIFHGVNKPAIHKKGNDYFFKALNVIQEKYPDKVDVITVSNLPYEEYIEKYNTCHILLDQIYGYDQGYNALEAMAKGKVVLSGGEKEWLEHYNLSEDEVMINVIPDVNQIIQKLEMLILNPKKIEEISKNARNFIEKKHDYIDVAKQYVKKWTE